MAVEVTESDGNADVDSDGDVEVSNAKVVVSGVTEVPISEEGDELVLTIPVSEELMLVVTVSAALVTSGVV